MKKVLISFILVITAVLSSCRTSVGISYMVPSEIDMGNYRNIAISSTVPYYGFARPARYIRTVGSLARFGYADILSTYDYGLKDEVADYATESLWSTLSASGYFSILPPDVTDKILDAGSIGMSARKEFMRRGVDAVIIPRIESMSVDEYIYSQTVVETRENSKGEEYEVDTTRFYYDADYYLSYSYTIVDVETERIVATRRFIVEDTDNFRISNHNFIFTYPERIFANMIDSTMSRITRQLVPLRTSVEITLMDNKPEVKAVNAAYDYAKDGDLSSALGLFLENYESTGHVPSGYNAALITAAKGDVDGAIEIASRVYNDSGSEEVYQLLSRLASIKRSNEESIRQIEGSNEKERNLDDSYYSSIYDALRR